MCGGTGVAAMPSRQFLHVCRCTVEFQCCSIFGLVKQGLWIRANLCGGRNFLYRDVWQWLLLQCTGAWVVSMVSVFCLCLTVALLWFAARQGLGIDEALLWFSEHKIGEERWVALDLMAFGGGWCSCCGLEQQRNGEIPAVCCLGEGCRNLKRKP